VQRIRLKIDTDTTTNDLPCRTRQTASLRAKFIARTNNTTIATIRAITHRVDTRAVASFFVRQALRHTSARNTVLHRIAHHVTSPAVLNIILHIDALPTTDVLASRTGNTRALVTNLIRRAHNITVTTIRAIGLGVGAHTSA
jgi:hypothetical protein